MDIVRASDLLNLDIEMVKKLFKDSFFLLTHTPPLSALTAHAVNARQRSYRWLYLRPNAPKCAHFARFFGFFDVVFGFFKMFFLSYFVDFCERRKKK